jgi:hypothetical protein
MAIKCDLGRKHRKRFLSGDWASPPAEVLSEQLHKAAVATMLDLEDASPAIGTATSAETAATKVLTKNPNDEKPNTAVLNGAAAAVLGGVQELQANDTDHDVIRAMESPDDESIQVSPFPGDLVAASEPLLLLRKGMLVQVQKVHPEGNWLFGFVVLAPKAPPPRRGTLRRSMTKWNSLTLVQPAPSSAETVEVEEGRVQEGAKKEYFGDDPNLGGTSSGWFPAAFARAPNPIQLEALQAMLGGGQQASDALATPCTWSEDPDPTR